MPKIQTYDIYTIVDAGGTKTYSATDNIDVYEINADGGSVTLLADMIFSYSGTPKVATEFKFQYGGGVTQNSSGAITVSFFGTSLTDEQALQQLLITAYWNGSTWEISILKQFDPSVTLTSFGSSPNANGLTISNGVLNMEPASASYGGGVSTTTQTFAGAKTFNILTGNVTIDSNGFGIGAVAPTTGRGHFNNVKTFTNPITTVTSDILSNNAATFNYSGINSQSVSGCASGLFSCIITGAYTPKSVSSIVGATFNNMSSADLEKTFGVRGQHSTLSTGGNTVTNFNSNFVAITLDNKTSISATHTIDENYDFYSSTPYQNNSSASSLTNFTITDHKGFYCEDYTLSSQIPIVNGSGSGGKNKATLTNSWQLYMDGEQATTTASYIGNRLGLAFATAPTANSNITAFLHIGAGTTDSAQIRLVVGSAPSAPHDGDIWLESNTNTGLKIRINGVTKTVTLS